MNYSQEIKSIKKYIRHLIKQKKEAEEKQNESPETYDIFISDTEQSLKELNIIIELLKKAQ